LQHLLALVSEPTACPEPDWTLDDYCDDVTNIAVCEYDGGACCLAEIKDDYCQECICKADGTRHPTLGKNEQK